MKNQVSTEKRFGLRASARAVFCSSRPEALSAFLLGVESLVRAVEASPGKLQFLAQAALLAVVRNPFPRRQSALDSGTFVTC